MPPAAAGLPCLLRLLLLLLPSTAPAVGGSAAAARLVRIVRGAAAPGPRLPGDVGAPRASRHRGWCHLGSLGINRGCTTRDAVRAIRALKDCGLKVDLHLMPDLPPVSLAITTTGARASTGARGTA